MTSPFPFSLRAYRPDDETSWVRCRALSFLATQYFDDVKPFRTLLADPAIALVATAPNGGGGVAGILDIEIDDAGATIDCIAVHPDYQGRGIATALLDAALPQLAPKGVTTLDAWTREDPAANAWYLANEFEENYRYLHVYVSDADDQSGFTTPSDLSLPISAFLHARVQDLDKLRSRYQRVHICRQYIRNLRVPSR